MLSWIEAKLCLASNAGSEMMSTKLQRKFGSKQALAHRIMELRRKGLTQSEIAAEVRTSQGTVSVILRESGMGGKLATAGKRW